jgi:hypothetical protein
MVKVNNVVRADGWENHTILTCVEIGARCRAR